MPLDGTVPRGAWSVSERLLTSYVGPACRVRRDDNLEIDIGFLADGKLDTASLISHCVGVNGSVVAAYDQSGNGSNLAQPLPERQPKIYDAITGVVRQGTSQVPAMLFDGSGDCLTRSDALGLSGAAAVHTFVNYRNTGSTMDAIIFSVGPGSVGRTFSQICFSPGTMVGNSLASHMRAWLDVPPPSTWHYLDGSIAAGQLIGDSMLASNGVNLSLSEQQAGSNVAANILNTSTSWNGASFGLQGYGSSVVVFDQVLSGSALYAVRTFFSAQN